MGGCTYLVYRLHTDRQKRRIVVVERYRVMEGEEGAEDKVQGGGVSGLEWSDG